MNRRGFLGTILALSAAPAIVRASSLMPIRVVEEGYQWDLSYIHGPGCPCFSCILQQTMRNHAKDLAASITRNNVLLENMTRYSGFNFMQHTSGLLIANYGDDDDTD